MQVKIVGICQNGKDTHVRSLTVYARDDSMEEKARLNIPREQGRKEKGGSLKREVNGVERGWIMEAYGIGNPKLG